MPGGGSVFTGYGGSVDSFPGSDPNRYLSDPISTIERYLAGVLTNPAPALDFHSGSIGSPVSLGVNTPTKIMDTASLAVGTWLINFGASVDAGGASVIEIRAAVDTATATLTGKYAGGADEPAVSTESEIFLTFIAVVTVTGTIQFIGIGANGVSNTVLATTRNAGYSPATGYTALRIL